MGKNPLYSSKLRLQEVDLPFIDGERQP